MRSSGSRGSTPLSCSLASRRSNPSFAFALASVASTEEGSQQLLSHRVRVDMGIEEQPK